MAFRICNSNKNKMCPWQASTSVLEGWDGKERGTGLNNFLYFNFGVSLLPWIKDLLVCDCGVV